MRQKSDILERRIKAEGDFAPFSPYFICNSVAGLLRDLWGVVLHKKCILTFVIKN